jgi:hypothetical protein
MIAASGSSDDRAGATEARRGTTDTGDTTTEPAGEGGDPYALGVECTAPYQKLGGAANTTRISDSVDKDCLSDWFASYASAVEPVSGGDADAVQEFLRYFDAAFFLNSHGTSGVGGFLGGDPGQLSVCEDSTSGFGCGEEASNVTAADSGNSVWTLRDTGLGMLVGDGQVLDVALTDSFLDDPPFPDPWAVGDGDAGATPDDTSSSEPNQPGPQGPTGSGGAATFGSGADCANGQPC